MSRRKVIYAKLHADLFVPGVGTLGSTLPPPSKSVKLEMETDFITLFCKAGNVEFTHPCASIQVMVHPSEPNKGTSKTDSKAT